METHSTELLKTILLNLNSPQVLDQHPWALSAGVDGQRLVELSVSVFRKMIPPSPPRGGKRLDTRWGAFGILAAQYFAPLLQRSLPPSSLRDSWDSIDRSILYFVDANGTMNDEQKTPYRFTQKELQPAPNSTLSDWHRRGIEQLATLMETECSTKKNTGEKNRINGKVLKRLGLAVLGTLLLVFLFLGWQAWGIYQRVRSIEQKVDALQGLVTEDLDMEQVPKIANQMHDLRTELDILATEAEPYLWMVPYSGWVPKYGGTLEQSDDLLSFAQSLITAADDGLSALAPAVEVALSNDQPVEVFDLLMQLNDSSPKLLSAQIALVQAQEARARIDTDRLLPRFSDIITQKVDPLFSTINGNFPMDDMLTLVRTAPELLGGGKAGPQTYLILMQNEDELRPTGGFLTAVGLAVVKDGKLLSINIDSSDSNQIDDFSKPYPIPPWQFEEFMNIEMFLLRDANWFTDFPTTVSWVEYFYSYTRGASADGTITLDMHVIAEMLNVLGPVRVDGVNIPISSENVREYLRSAEQAPPQGVDRNTWNRKQFIADLAQPILEKALNARGETLSELVPVLISLLDEKHILLQFDNPEITTLLEQRNWDGAVRIPENSDFLMVVDTNMGYNKSNAVMKVELGYNADLSLLNAPKATLSVKQTNLATVELPCEPYAMGRFLPIESTPGEIPDPIYNMDECHWGYLRVYLPGGTSLTSSNPQEIPETAAWLGQAIPARTDDLGDEDIANAQVFGMMTLTPTNQTISSVFEYSLPMRVVTLEDGLYTYRLKVQKQPGTAEHLLNFTLILPQGAALEEASIPLTETSMGWMAQLDLRQDLWIEVIFRMGP